MANPYDELRKAREMLTHELHSDAIFLARKAHEELTRMSDNTEKQLAQALIYEIQGRALLIEKEFSRASSYLGQSLLIYSRLSKMKYANDVAQSQVNALWELSRLKVKQGEHEKGAYFLNQASMSLSQAGLELFSAELKACAFAVRAEGTSLEGEKKQFYQRAVQSLQNLSRVEPVIHGHFNYFNALLLKLTRPESALNFAIEAHNHYKLTDRKDWIERAFHLINEITSELDIVFDKS
jgi:hypothetical protein